MTAGGIAMVVAVFVMTLAIAQGFRATLVASGSIQNAIVLRKGSTAESLSAVARSDVPLVESLPQVARAADGRPLASPELVLAIALPRQSDNQPANVPIRGVGSRAYDVRESLQIVEGRRFAPGSREINVGKLAVGRFTGADARQRRELRRRHLAGGRRLHRRRCVVRVRDLGRHRSDGARRSSVPAISRLPSSWSTRRRSIPSRARSKAIRDSTCSRSASRTTTPPSRWR